MLIKYHKKLIVVKLGEVIKRIVLLGASNSIVQKGLSKGLKDTLMSAGGGGGRIS